MLDIALVAHDQPSTIVHPREASRHLPAVAITGAGSDRPPAFGTLPTACHRRDSGLDAAPSQLLAEGLAVIGLVCDQFLGPCAWATTPLRYFDRGQGRRGQCVFMRARTRHMQSDRQSLTVGHHHHFRALADFGLADAGAPFFAGTKLPSRNARVHSSWLRVSRWLGSARQMYSRVPSADHCRRRRQHVTGEPYARGRSSQAQPALSTYRMPFKVVRSSARGRPGPPRRFGSKGSITVHCWSVSSCRLMSSI